MPIVSSFFGIIIRMFFDDHAPPHFHAEHQGQIASFKLNGTPLVGEIRSATARKLIREWARLHQVELEANWKRAKKLQTIQQIAPLE
ncbi:MAG: DUF4160 domain-containing protein [Acidobacteriota bacterium]